MSNFEADVAFADRVIETVVLTDLADASDAEFEAMNNIRDRYPDAFNVEVLEVREV